MKKKIFFIGCIAATILSCNNADKTTIVKKDSTVIVVDTTKIVTTSVRDTSVFIKAKFVNFTFGDAPHFIFEDNTSTKVEFGLDEDTLTNFSIELPANKANADNQGWASNKALEGKWFNIKYVTRKMVLYEGGPSEDTKVIIDAKPVQ